MLILGIETSCDETAAAVVKDGKTILSNKVSSQIKFHAKYGGVVPEIASRKQIELINFVLEEARIQAKIEWSDIDAVAVTTSPGLIGSLLVGRSSAKIFSYVFKVPLYEIDHVEAHLYANFLSDKKPKMPFLGLVVSGGHTSMFIVENHKEVLVLGKTRDDAAGEAFDKVAKLLGLPYPGGPEIEKRALKGNAKKIEFPRPYLHGSYDFSFSGLKTAVANYVQVKSPTYRRGRQKSKVPLMGILGTGAGKTKEADVCAGFQEAVVETLVNKTIKTALKKNIRRIVIGGGVTANSRLRKFFIEQAKKNKIELFIPPISLCLDNAAMIATRAFFKYSA